MGAANGVKACLLEIPDTNLFCVGKFGSADDAIVVMQTASAQLHHFAIYPQSMPGIQLQPADTKGARLRILYFSIHQDSCPIGIQVGRIIAPQMRVVHVKPLPLHLSVLLGHGHRHLIRSGQLSFCVQQLDPESGVLHPESLIAEDGLRLDHRKIMLRIYRRQMNSIRNQMDPVSHHEINIAENAASGVPSAARNVIFNHYFDLVSLTEDKILRDIQIEIAVAVGMISCKGVIDIHECVLIDTLKFQRHNLFHIVCIQFKLFPIDIILLTEIAIPASVGLLRIPACADGRIMRKIHLFLRSASAGNQIFK